MGESGRRNSRNIHIHVRSRTWSSVSVVFEATAMSRSVCLLSFCVSRRPHLLRDLFTGRGTSFGYSKMVSSRRRGRVCRALVGFDTPGQRVAATAKTVSNIQLSRGTAATATARAARRCWPFCCIIHNSDPKLNNSSVPIIRRQLGSANGTKKTKGIAKAKTSLRK